MASPLTRPKNIPDSPGCYLFRDANGRVIYVGKAKSLRSRLSSYFQAPYLLHPRTASMVEQAADVEWIVTKNEVESLHLEYNLIKKNSPRFNVRYKDDKSYPYLAITVGEEYPRATVMRGKRRQGVRFFGPYAHAYASLAVVGWFRDGAVAAVAGGDDGWHLFRIRETGAPVQVLVRPAP